jgi:hypothetical protein
MKGLSTALTQQAWKQALQWSINLISTIAVNRIHRVDLARKSPYIRVLGTG